MSTDLRSIHFEEMRSRITGNRALVLECLRQHGPATAKELAALMRWDKTSVRPRLCELVEIHFARPTGERRNGEHVFRAMSDEEAQANHDRTIELPL